MRSNETMPQRMDTLLWLEMPDDMIEVGLAAESLEGAIRLRPIPHETKADQETAVDMHREEQVENMIRTDLIAELPASVWVRDAQASLAKGHIPLQAVALVPYTGMGRPDVLHEFMLRYLKVR
ncbi:MAG TPA: hypothetical protein VNG32_04905 [Candidatus Dormibacteraeota bacterium]|nr:hypothetical protein [Candidatus Dormibacteraeota bacterium]